MSDQSDLQNAVIDRLSRVIDSETGINVIRMKLVQDLTIDANGITRYIFKPSSPLCPIAVPLALSIIEAISEVPGVSGQKLTVIDYVQADELNEILRSILE